MLFGMNQIKSLHLVPKDLFFKITLLKSMMYCGVLWGLYHQQGWAMMSDHEDHLFPFWLNSVQAHKYAQLHWPDYTPRKITPQDFQESLLPTLTRLKVTPTLCNSSSRKFKLTTQQMRHLFFSESLQPA
jgi:hypothetical protein